MTKSSPLSAEERYKQLLLRLGATIAAAMSQRNKTFKDLDTELEVNFGTTKRIVTKLLSGKSVPVLEIFVILDHLGYDIVFELTDVSDKEPPHNEV